MSASWWHMQSPALPHGHKVLPGGTAAREGVPSLVWKQLSTTLESQRPEDIRATLDQAPHVEKRSRSDPASHQQRGRGPCGCSGHCPALLCLPAHGRLPPRPRSPPTLQSELLPPKNPPALCVRGRCESVPITESSVNFLQVPISLRSINAYYPEQAHAGSVHVGVQVPLINRSLQAGLGQHSGSSGPDPGSKQTREHIFFHPLVLRVN